MATPAPPIRLQGHCSVIDDGVLYVYSPDALLSLPLSEGGQWTRLPGGISVTGAACVRVVPGDDASRAALYVVGGTPVDDSDGDYSGLQKFTFADQEWQTITPISPVTQNRRLHSATYLNSSSSILVFAGSQTRENDTYSSETFLISTEPPFDVRAFTSNCPPVIAPYVLPWNSSHAVTLGGESDNRKIYTFGPDEGWRDLGVQLPQGLPDPATSSCTLVLGDDLSKVLDIYDLGVSPNEVTSLVLQDAGGEPPAPGQIVGRPRSSDDRRRKRDLTVADWPEYDATNAPTVIRAGFSIAQDADGLAVMTGGNDEDPLCIFDQRANSWLDTNALFAGNANVETTSNSREDAVSPESSSSSSSPSSDEGSSEGVRSQLTILGATLGAVFGLAAILGILLLFLRYRREKRKAAEDEAYMKEEKDDRLSFADRGAPPYLGVLDDLPGHSLKESMFGFPESGHEAHSSYDIAAGTAGLGLGHGHKRGAGALGSDGSTAGLVLASGPMGTNAAYDLSRIGSDRSSPRLVPRTEPSPPAAVIDSTPRGLMVGGADTSSRGSGWSRYFANNEATDLANINPDRSTFASENDDMYGDGQRISNQARHMPAPLEVPKRPGLSQVASGSPTLGNAARNPNAPGMAISEGMAAELDRHGSVSSTASTEAGDQRTLTFLSDYSGNDNTGWTPVTAAPWDPRPASSNYTGTPRESEIPPLPPDLAERAMEAQARNVAAELSRDRQDTMTDSYYPKSGAPSYYYQPHADESTDSSSAGGGLTDFPLPPSEPVPVTEEERRVSPTRRRITNSQDMSWLNLGAGVT